jgi:hypothetical protein
MTWHHDLTTGRDLSSHAKSKHTCFLSGIENVHIISALDDLISGWSLQGDLIGHHLQAAGSAGLQRFMLYCISGPSRYYQ